MVSSYEYCLANTGLVISLVLFELAGVNLLLYFLTSVLAQVEFLIGGCMLYVPKVAQTQLLSEY